MDGRRDQDQFEAVNWTTPEAKALFETVRGQGYSDHDIKRVIETEDTPQAAFDLLKALSEIVSNSEVQALAEQAKAQGVDEEFLKKVLVASGTPQDAIADLKVLATPKGKRITPKTPKPPPYERELDPHEEWLLEEMLAGELEPQTTVG